MKKAITLFLLTALLTVSLALTAHAAATQPAGPYTLEDAKQLILDRFPGVTIASIREERDDGKRLYEGRADDDEYTYKFEIDAQTGLLLELNMKRIRRSSDAAPANNTLISEESARQIALAQAGDGASIRSIRLDREDGRQVYEGKGREGGFEFEFEIDAVTGAILDWDWDD